MICGEPGCGADATHEVRVKRLTRGQRSSAPWASEHFCSTHALAVWRRAGYEARVYPLYTALLATGTA